MRKADKSELRGNKIFNPDTIEGTDILRKEIPDELQDWHKFCKISELHYNHIFDEKYNNNIFYMDLMLSDNYYNYSIKLYLFNVTGKLSFDMDNGFYGGLTIDDYSDWGYENHCRFRISSLECDIESEIYCERIRVELVR